MQFTTAYFASVHSYSCLLVVTLLAFGTGLYTGERIASVRWFKAAYNRPEAPSNEQARSFSAIETLGDSLSDLSSLQYACNTRLAFEHLTHLYNNRVKLDEHARRGDANRARTGTINRKAVAARASESAFRECLNVMMPEALQEWDDNGGNYGTKQWNEEKEKRTGGITFQELEETAAELDVSKVIER